MINFLNEAKEIKQDLVTWREHIHKNPELGFEEYNTSNYIMSFLKSEGIEGKYVSNTGIVAIIKGSGEKTIGIRADIDALPIQEKTNTSYKSTRDGIMHACGHDAHTAILMGVAKILNKNRASLMGNVKLIFEPAEETVGGARFMIKEGILDDPKVDAVIGLHVDENIKFGEIGIKSGAVNAASNPFNIKIEGKGGHGAHPEVNVDPILIASNIIVALQSIVSREISPTDAAVLTIGSIHGGTAQNIIPDEVNLSGIIRAMKTEDRSKIIIRVKEISEGIAKAMRGNAVVEIIESYPCLYNDETLTEYFLKLAKDLLGDKVNLLSKPSMGVESFAYFAQERPSFFYYLGCRNEERGIINSAHSPLFDIDEECLVIGAALQCSFAFNYLINGGN
ncbi:MAG TPA: M20 family metallopeptidase [Clostridiaceae bacterium]